MADKKMTNEKTNTKRTSSNGNSGSRAKSTSKKGATKTSTKRSDKSTDTNKAAKRNVSPKAIRAQRGRRTERISQSMADEIRLAVTLLVSILLFLSYINLCGTVGEWLNTIVFGTMGLLGYLFPFILFFAVAFALANRRNRAARIKIIASIGFIICFLGLIELMTGYDPEMSWLDYFRVAADRKNGGGILGGTPVCLLCPLFDSVATIVIFVILMIIFLMLITGKELFAYIKKLTAQTMEEHRMSKEEREALRMEREIEAYDDYNLYDTEIKRNRKVTLGDSESAYEEEPEKKMSFIETLKARGQETERQASMFQQNMNRNYEKAETEAQPETPAKISNLNSIPVTMQEISSAESLAEKRKSALEQITISGTYQREETPIYEQEMERKFGGKNKENTESDYASFANVNPVTGEIQESSEFADFKEIDAEHDYAFSKTNPVKTEQAVPTVSETPVAEAPRKESSQAHSTETGRTQNARTTEPNTTQNARAEKPAETSKPESEGEASLTIEQVEPPKKYVFPPIELLAKPKIARGANERELKETAAKLQSTLESFGVRVSIPNITCGPSVTQYELLPEQGVKVSQITKLADDIKLNLAAADIRIEAPIPGKAAVGIEVPNKESSPVILRELLESDEFKKHKSNLAFTVGKDISGQNIVSDIGKMPHMLIAGATGSGKSVCINTIIMSILYKADPKNVRLIMIDPKVVELSVYNGIPHLLIPVVTDPKLASQALNWAVAEMTDRYKKFADLGVRDLNGYNEKIENFDEPNPNYPHLPQIVIIVDELADLMMVASAKEVEDAICRLAQMARAAGLHLILATQRPSVNVITGVIKANVPSRVAFAVTSAVDSRTILDGVGAEKLLGKGDMLFFPSGYPKPVRIQGAFVSDSEVGAVVDFLKENNEKPSYNEEVKKKILTPATSSDDSDDGSKNDQDRFFIDAGRYIIENQKASINNLQRIFQIGFNRAARIMDQLTAAGVIGPEEGTKARKILMTMEEFESQIVNK